MADYGTLRRDQVTLSCRSVDHQPDLARLAASRRHVDWLSMSDS
jgi:hypothetical protein